MNTEFFEGITFESKDYTKIPVPKGDYENCMFKKCDFSGSDLSEIRFEDSEFLTCNLSMAAVANTVFRNVAFKNCKMLGINLEDCSQFGISFRFDECNLSHASFFGGKFRRTTFSKSRLHEVIFTESDLVSSIFDECDLSRAIFEQTNLEGADFRSSFNFSINPNKNRMKRSRFSSQGAASLLDSFGIKID